MMHVKVRYKCNGCGANRLVEVPKRARCIELKLWMRQVMRRVAQDHKEFAPHCGEGKVDLMLPTDKDGRVGRVSPTPEQTFEEGSDA